MTKNIFKRLFVAQLLLVSSVVFADTYHFLPINPNNNNIGEPNPVGNQLTVNITDGGGGGEFGSALFVFTNPVGISSSIVDVFFSDPAPTIFSGFSITNQTTGVNFTLDTLSPSNFPEGGPSFVEVASADADGAGTNEISGGINALNESLTILALFNGTYDFDRLIEQINSGDFRIALQTRDNPAGGNPSTDRWLNDRPVSAVPIPAAGWLFGSALVGLMGLRRRRL